MNTLKSTTSSNMSTVKRLEKALKRALSEQDEHPLSGSANRKVRALQREIEAEYRKKQDESQRSD